MQTGTKTNLGDLLIEERLIERDKLMQAHRAATRLGAPLVTILLEQKLIKEETLAAALRKCLGMEIFSSVETPVDLEAVHEVPFEEANRYRLLPLQLKIKNNERYLRVAMVNPLDSQAIEDLEYSTTTTVEPLIAKASDLAEALRHYYRTAMPGKSAARLRDGGAWGGWTGNTPTNERLARQMERASPMDRASGSTRSDKIAGQCRLEALINILAAKGLITRDEYQDELRVLISATESK